MLKVILYYLSVILQFKFYSFQIYAIVYLGLEPRANMINGTNINITDRTNKHRVRRCPTNAHGMGVVVTGIHSRVSFCECSFSTMP